MYGTAGDITELQNINTIQIYDMGAKTKKGSQVKEKKKNANKFQQVKSQHTHYKEVRYKIKSTAYQVG